MKPSMRAKLDHLDTRLAELNSLLTTEEATKDMDAYRKLTREHSDIATVVEQFALYKQAEADAQAAEEMRKDPEMKDFADEEQKQALATMEALEGVLQKLLLPKDENDDRNVFLEIRAGTGGDESALFAGDLLRMYTRFAERQGWKVEVVSSAESDLGGYKEVVLRLVGQSVYSRLKFESGGHRVQRVPQTETQGRIHTSACTVAVMPEADELEAVKINPAELRIDTFRASGAGGQHINKTDSAVRITHLPTGTVVECQDDRSQHRNKEQAMKVLVSRIMDAREREKHQLEAQTRKSLVGSGDRSDRIRTYNFPQGRITDHRINLTLYKIDAMMDGDIDDLCNALASEHQAELLAALGDNWFQLAMSSSNSLRALLGKSTLPSNEAKILLAFILEKHYQLPRSALLSKDDLELSPAALEDWMYLQSRRMSGEPIAYLLGEKGFYNIELKVGPGVLIPRPETELLVEIALTQLAKLSDQPRILDLGTGSGAIALAVAHNAPKAQITATDQSDEALMIAKQNAATLGLIDRVEFRQGSWYEALADQTSFDIILSNPPYIANKNPHLSQGDLRFEPVSALTDGSTGLSCLETIISQAGHYLKPGGLLAVEHGFDQSEAVITLMKNANLEGAQVHKDLSGHARCASARKSISK